MERWRAFFAKANAPIWTVIEQAINVAAMDHPEVFRERRGDIAETLFAKRLLQVVSAHDEVVSLGVLADDDDQPTSAMEDAMEEGELKDDFEERALAACSNDEAHRLHSCYDAEVLREDVDQEVALVEDVTRIKQAIRDSDQPENILLELLQKLEDMHITVHALKVTEIGKQVNVLRKHPSKYVRAVAKQLVKHWKCLVDEWVERSVDATEVAAASPVALAGPQSRKEPEVVKRLRTPLSPPVSDASPLPPEKSFSGELTEHFSFIDEEGICGQNNKRNNLDGREHLVKRSVQNSSRSHSGSALTYSSDCDARINSCQTWGLQTPGEMGSATRDNHTSEGIEKSLEPASRILSLTNGEMGHRGTNHLSDSQPLSKVSIKRTNLAKVSTNSLKTRVAPDVADAGRPAIDNSQRSHHAQKGNVQYGSGNEKPLPNKLSDKSQAEQKLEIAKRKLHQGYQQAENAKKQRTVQVLDFPDLPKSSEVRGKLNSAMPSKAGSQAGHWSQNKRHG